MKTKAQLAIETFANGYNCSQSVLSVFSQNLGVSKNEALKLANPFGAGIAYRQETCGAVTGALMAIGLKFGKGENGSQEEKEKTYDISRLFIEEFKRSHGTICCRELMNDLDMSTPEGMTEIMGKDLFRLKCTKHIQTAVEIVEKIMEKTNK